MKKKAFTLTELLVVVVIIGVLAAVVLPRFTKVLEARRTTEAEDIMRAVRTEQEARCMLDKNYTAQKKDLASFPVNEGNNYTYAFNTVGMEAESKNKNYTLKMKSYADGGICCEGADCNSLGKNYPSCASYKAVANIECAAEGAPEPEPEPDPNVCELYDHQENCPVGYTGGSRYYKVNADCTGYDVEDTCVPESNPDPEPDPDPKPDPDPDPDPNKCTTEGEEKYIDFVDCSTEKWKRCKNGKWEEYNKAVTSTDCRQGCGQPADENQDCPEGKTGTQTRTYTCDQSTGSWEAGEWTGECTCTPTHDGQTHYWENCEEGYSGVIVYDWDAEKCEYKVSHNNCTKTGCTWTERTAENLSGTIGAHQSCSDMVSSWTRNMGITVGGVCSGINSGDTWTEGDHNNTKCFWNATADCPGLGSCSISNGWSTGISNNGMYSVSCRGKMTYLICR